MADTLTGFLFSVFTSNSDEGRDSDSGELYLRARADARFLEVELGDTLAEGCGQSVHTSDDSVYRGTDLPVLEQLVRDVRDKVEAKPPSWPVVLGYEYKPGEAVGAPIHGQADRERLTEFLTAVLDLVKEAQREKRFLHWAGGE